MEATRIESAIQVTNLQGRAFIIGANGITKAVTVGQVLAPGMVLLTDTNTQITYADAPTAPKVAATSINEAADTAPVTASDIAAIQAAILAGEDPSKLFEAPAAGNPTPTGVFNGSSGNAGFVVIDRVGDSLIAEAGYDTAFANALGPFVFEELGDLLADDGLDGDVNDDAPPLASNSIPELVIEVDPPLTPTNSFPQAGNNVAFVEERALDPNGSNAPSDNESTTGRFTINTGNDELGKLEVQGADGLWVDVTLGGTVPGAYGTVTVTVENGEYLWRYDLTGAIEHPKANKTDGEDTLPESFAVRVTDDDGDQASGQLTIHILDDGPIAYADTNSVSEGGTAEGNVLTDGAKPDEFGADGAAAGGGVVGVKAGADTSAPATGNLDSAFAGTYGTLTLNANGSYTYTKNANTELPKDAKDIFTYTIQDGDGDLSTTTLTINLSDSGIVVTPSTEVEVYEKALDLEKDGDDLAAGTVEGSDPDDTRETATGQLAATGGSGTLTYSLVSSTEGTYGQIQLNADGSYTYTLTSPVTSTTDNDGANTELGKETFTYTVTDANGNSQQGTISIDIVDDVPEAKSDIKDVGEGGSVGGNVLDNDEFGADGRYGVTDKDIDDRHGVVGVMKGDTGTAVLNGVSTVIEGDFGSLTLNADGSYTYTSNANTELPDDAQDVFTYTIQDGDGDQSTTTLTINLSDSGLAISESPTLVVYEKALDLEKDGDDLAAGTVEGSDPDDTRETATGQLAATGGSGTLTYSLVSSTEGTYGQIQLNADGSYTYTLTSPVTSTTGNDGANTELGKETFTYTVTDANGNSQQGTISIDIVDDVPEAVDDNFSVVEGGLPCYNLMLIIDTSESMQHENRLVLAKEALINLINSYEGKASELRISVIDFGSDVKGTRVDMTAAEAIEHIDSLTADGYTNYADPLNQAQTILTGQLENDKEGEVHRVYFISDGGPNRGVAPADWQVFVDDENIDVTAVAVGIEGDWAIDELDKVGNSGDETLEIESADELDATLQGTVPTSTVVTGNVLDNDEGGADGVGRVISVTYGEDTYEVPENGSVDIITSDGVFTMKSTGDFTYTGPGDVPEAGLKESFGYTMTDGDGDTSSATLNITVKDGGQTQPDVVDNEESDGNGGNNGGEGSTCPLSGYWIDHISLPHVAASFAGLWGAALAAADLLIDMGDINTGINLSWQNCPDGIELTREDRFDGESYVGERLIAFIDNQLEQAGSPLFFTLDMNIDGSYEFDLHNLDPMYSGASLVGDLLKFEFTAKGVNGEETSHPFSIEIDSEVQHLSGSALAGTIQTEVNDKLHILGLDGDDKLAGGDDIDVLIGGLGNDELSAGMGNNLLNGDEGIDTFIFTEIDPGSINVITDFTPENRLDLSALLTDAGLDDLSDYLSFSLDNGDTLLQVSADNGNSQQIRFENVDLLAMYGSANSVELVNSMLEDQVLVINS
ncbi:hypothetical protein CBP31_02675 [Oceanisphaera profunda]|uniref:VWFA domain-containing protein n=1 Tax=Oceanisphaera profunda TaxID=1416627 RepID=A0A1Y0D2D2_9GAMM|nr:retention module-containing protein [Oceanisphaera profunda]ART81669.1 hypothetical protein CBP31_02675 [Oceanisphaera profunda]